MLELLRLFPRRPLAISLAGWTWFFVAQIFYLSIFAYIRYVPPSEPPPMDRLWFVYTELPSALPMAAIYAVCMVFVAQVIGRFMSPDNPDNPTVADLYEQFKRNPAKALLWVCIRVIFLLGVVGFIIDSFVPLPPWIATLSAGAIGLFVFQIFIAPWSNWVTEQISVRDADNARPESATSASPRRRRRPPRPRNASTHRQQSNPATGHTRSPSDDSKESVNGENEG